MENLGEIIKEASSKWVLEAIGKLPTEIIEFIQNHVGISIDYNIKRSYTCDGSDTEKCYKIVLRKDVDVRGFYHEIAHCLQLQKEDTEAYELADKWLEEK